MPRTNRPRRGRAGSGDDGSVDLERALYGFPRSESKRGAVWNVQRVSAASAVKEYVCPGCGRGIAEGQAHTVAWRADGLLGDAADLAARRHWHDHCWKVS